jgi:hypothetical protein
MNMSKKKINIFRTGCKFLCVRYINEGSHRLGGFHSPLPKLIQRSIMIIATSDKLCHASVLKLHAGEFNSGPRSRESSVGIATGYGLDDQGGGSSSPGGVKNFHFSMSSRLALGSTQPPIKMGTGGSFPGVKRQGRGADHSPPTSAEVQKMWIYTSTPPYVFMV